MTATAYQRQRSTNLGAALPVELPGANGLASTSIAESQHEGTEDDVEGWSSPGGAQPLLGADGVCHWKCWLLPLFKLTWYVVHVWQAWRRHLVPTVRSLPAIWA